MLHTHTINELSLRMLAVVVVVCVYACWRTYSISYLPQRSWVVSVSPVTSSGGTPSCLIIEKFRMEKLISILRAWTVSLNLEIAWLMPAIRAQYIVPTGGSGFLH